MRTVKVLFLDSIKHLEYLPSLLKEGIEYHVQHDRGGESYAPLRPETAEKIRTVTAAKGVDLIVIGNNVGHGVERAEAVDPAMRSRAVIVWHMREPGDSKAYEALGYTNFCTRKELPAWIKGALLAN